MSQPQTALGERVSAYQAPHDILRLRLVTLELAERVWCVSREAAKSRIRRLVEERLLRKGLTRCGRALYHLTQLGQDVTGYRLRSPGSDGTIATLLGTASWVAEAPNERLLLFPGELLEQLGLVREQYDLIAPRMKKTGYYWRGGLGQELSQVRVTRKRDLNADQTASELVRSFQRQKDKRPDWGRFVTDGRFSFTLLVPTAAWIPKLQAACRRAALPTPVHVFAVPALRGGVW